MPTSPPPATLGRLELRCPPLPHSLLEAVHLMDHPDEITVRSVTAFVERDPLVVARLFQRVNSAYYGLQRAVSSVERAVVLLGPVAVVGMVVGMNMLRLRSVLSGPAGPTFARLIEHSIATAYLTRHLAESMPAAAFPDGTLRTGGALTAGLLHDFGKIILVYTFPEEAVALYDGGGLDAHVCTRDLREAERLLFGCDHTEAGEFAALRLRFPESILHVIRHHHAPEEAAGDAPVDRLARTVAAANLAAKAFGYAVNEPLDWDACAASTAWRLLVERDLPLVGSTEELAQMLEWIRPDVHAYVSAFAAPPPEE